MPFFKGPEFYYTSIFQAALKLLSAQNHRGIRPFPFNVLIPPTL